MSEKDVFTEAPDLAHRTAMLQEMLSWSPDADPGMVQSLGLKTAGLLPTDIRAVVADAAAKAVSRAVDSRAFCSPELQGASPMLPDAS